LDRYEKKLDGIENGAFPPAKEVADFEQAIELTGTVTTTRANATIFRHPVPPAYLHPIVVVFRLREIPLLVVGRVRVRQHQRRNGRDMHVVHIAVGPV